MDELADFLSLRAEWTPKKENEPVVKTEDDTVVNQITSVSPSGAEPVNNLEMKVDALRDCVYDLLQEVRENRERPASVPVKCLMKPRDIPVLELRHLSGVRVGRLAVFFFFLTGGKLLNR